MLIQDVECKTGLDQATVRLYEKEGIVVQPERRMVTVHILMLMYNSFSKLSCCVSWDHRWERLGACSREVMILLRP